MCTKSDAVCKRGRNRLQNLCYDSSIFVNRNLTCLVVNDMAYPKRSFLDNQVSHSDSFAFLFIFGKANKFDAMLLNVDGLDDSVMSTLPICDLADEFSGRDPPSDTFWDCSPYSDLAQTFFQNDPFSAAYCREKNSTQASTLSMDSPTLFPCQWPFSTEPFVLKQLTTDDSWRPSLSPGLSSPVDDSCSSALLVCETGKENTPPSPTSPTLNDFSGFSAADSIWADSPLARFGTHSPQKRKLGAQDAFVDTPGLSPASMYLPRPPTRSRGQQKGLLLGWGDASHFQAIPVSSALRPRSLSRSPDVDAVDPKTLTGSPLRKRPRRSTLSREPPLSPKSESLSFDSSSLDDSDSDDYRPSPKFVRFKAKPSADATCSPKPAFRTLKREKSTKGKQKGSAALALAVVTQIREVKREAETLQVSLDPDSLDPVRVYHEGNYVVKKRKNQPIPVPIPVPNLHKISRGRKVPLASDCEPTASSVGAPSIDHGLGGGQPRGSTRSRRGIRSASASDESEESRSFVCVIPGCGKCFVRGEHLKRHVRSIHTNDKPHVCPIEGCNKSFSRRDNLGQHVRVHLQP